jgi:hypothetical protein
VPLPPLRPLDESSKQLVIAVVFVHGFPSVSLSFARGASYSSANQLAFPPDSTNIVRQNASQKNPQTAFMSCLLKPESRASRSVAYQAVPGCRQFGAGTAFSLPVPPR